MEKLKITEADLTPPAISPGVSPVASPGTEPPVATGNTGLSTGVKLALFPLVLLLPVLCVVALAIRPALNEKPLELREAWFRFLGLLLAVSGIINCIGGTMIYLAKGPANGHSRSATPGNGSAAIRTIEGISRISGEKLNASALKDKLKPLILVADPSVKARPPKLDDLKDQSIGTAAILYIDGTSCLAITSANLLKDDQPPTLHNAHGHAKPELVAKLNTFGLVLIKFGLENQPKPFAQPIGSPNAMKDGDAVFSMGHTRGEFFTGREGTYQDPMDRDMVNTSLSFPSGYRGAPVYDLRGHLLGIATTAKGDEVVAASVLLNQALWTFEDGQKHIYDKFAAKVRNP